MTEEETVSSPVIDLAGVFPPVVDRDRFDPWIDRLTPAASVTIPRFYASHYRCASKGFSHNK